MIEAKFFLQLLVRLLTNPAGLDGRGKRLEWRVFRQIDEIIFTFAIGAALANQPDYLSWHVLPTHVVDALRWPVGDPHPYSGEAGGQAAFGATAPAERRPRHIGKHGLSRGRPWPATGKISATSAG